MENTPPGNVIRAARALAGLTREKLAKEAGITRRGLDRIENEGVHPKDATMAAICAALDAHGVEMTDGDQPGVRLKRRETG
jgi:DNA-binding XRE family transcriptional regulator